MIFDQQNMYLDKKTISGNTTSDVLYNMGGGDAHDPLFLAIMATTNLATSGTITAVLETSDAEAFGTKTTLASYTLPASTKGVLVKAKLPYGMKKYSRLVISGATAGVLTAGLTATVPNWP